jgi:hypothetical protein
MYNRGSNCPRSYTAFSAVEPVSRVLWRDRFSRVITRARAWKRV